MGNNDPMSVALSASIVRGESVVLLASTLEGHLLGPHHRLIIYQCVRKPLIHCPRGPTPTGLPNFSNAPLDGRATEGGAASR